VYLSPEAQRLLADVEQAHQGLIRDFAAPEDVRRGLLAVRDALAAAVSGVSERDLVTTRGDQWSMAQVLVHVARHDHQYEEAHRRGLIHFVEHGLEHARQLWLLRDTAASFGGR
jgi:hypothetical protein